jgi:hypothetical protein
MDKSGTQLVVRDKKCRMQSGKCRIKAGTGGGRFSDPVLHDRESHDDDPHRDWDTMAKPAPQSAALVR